MIELVLGSLLLVFLGILIGASWAAQATQSQSRRQAQERRRLNDEWTAIRTARRQQTEYQRRASPLYERNWHFAHTTGEERTDNDYVAGR